MYDVNYHGIPLVLLSDIVRHHSRRTIPSIPKIRTEFSYHSVLFCVLIGTSVCGQLFSRTKELPSSFPLFLFCVWVVRLSVVLFWVFQGTTRTLCVRNTEPGTFFFTGRPRQNRVVVVHFPG